MKSLKLILQTFVIIFISLTHSNANLTLSQMQLNNDIYFQNKPINKFNNDIYSTFYELMQQGLLTLIWTINKTMISDKCLNSLNKNTLDLNFLHKLVADSGRNRNDLGSFSDCKKALYNDTGNEKQNLEFLNELDFLILNIRNPVIDPITNKEVSSFDARYQSGDYICGLCIVKGCNATEFLNITTNYIINNPFFGFNPGVEATVHLMNDIILKADLWLVASIISILCLLLYFVFTCFPKLPTFIFKKCCLRCTKARKNMNEGLDRTSINQKSVFSSIATKEEPEKKKSKVTEHSDHLDLILDQNAFDSDATPSDKGDKKYDDVLLSKFSDCFDLYQNFEFHENKVTSGLPFLNGLISICMIFYSLAIVNYAY